MQNFANPASFFANPAITSGRALWPSFAMVDLDKLDDGAPNRIAELREARGWSRAELAEKLDCGEQHVWRLEKGKRGLSDKWLIRLSRAFGLPQAAFLRGQELRDADLDYGDAERLKPAETAPPALGYDDADFMVDIQLAFRRLYGEERVTIEESELVRAAFDAWTDLAPLAQGQRARRALLEAHLRGQRQFLRRQRTADLLGAKRPTAEAG